MKLLAVVALVAAPAAAYDYGDCVDYVTGDVYTGEALGFAFDSVASTCCYTFAENSCSHSPTGTPTALPTSAPTSTPSSVRAGVPWRGSPLSPSSSLDARHRTPARQPLEPVPRRASRTLE